MTRPTSGLALALLAVLALSTSSLATDIQPTEDRSHSEARKLVADALYLESGMGDCERAAAIYAGLLERSGELGTELLGEVAYRRGRVLETLGRSAEAEVTYRDALIRFASSSWSMETRSRVLALERQARMLRSLPETFDFSDDLGGLYHPPRRAAQGRLRRDDRSGGIALWETWVCREQDDMLEVPIDPELKLRGEISFSASSDLFPAHVEVQVLVGGEAWSTAPITIEPSEGWTEVKLRARDLRRQGPGARGRTFRPSTGVTALVIRDVTALHSTDRGENRILLDELRIR